MMKPYEQMTVMEKRVALAQDVKARLLAKKLPVDGGAYAKTEDGPGELDWQRFCDAAHKDQCRVCADGAFMLAVLDKEGYLDDCRVVPDHIKPAIEVGPYHSWKMNSKEACVAALKHLFDKETIDLIEAAFEADYDVIDCKVDDEEYQEAFDRAIQMGQNVSSDEDRSERYHARLVAICDHLIENDGKWLV